MKDIAMVTDLCSWFGGPPNQTKPNNAYLPLHDIPFWKRKTKDIAMVTSDAELGDLQTKPNKTYLSLLIISFWKCQKNDNVLVTSATDLGDIQTKDNDLETPSKIEK